MSPVSRGRAKKKNTSTKRGSGAGAGSGPGAVERLLAADRSRAVQASPPPTAGGALEVLMQAAGRSPDLAQVRARTRAWWPDSHRAVLDAAGPLLDASGPDDLEDAVCSLIGEEWGRRLGLEREGFHRGEWLEALVAAAGRRIAEPAVRRLLHGVALMGGPAAGRPARDLLAAASTGDDAPWLAEAPVRQVAPEPLVLRDRYGLRFGLLVQVAGATGAPRTYLIDVDRCSGMAATPHAGYHPDVESATLAWRGFVGESARDVVAGPAPADLLGEVLPETGTVGMFFIEPCTPGQWREMFRQGGVVDALVEARQRAGLPPCEAVPRRVTDTIVTDLLRRFRTWAAAHHVQLPAADDEGCGVADLVDIWVHPGMGPETAVACSPHRIVEFTGYVLDDRLPQYRDELLGMLPAWVAFLRDQQGTAPGAAAVLDAWAERAGRESAAVAALGGTVNLPVDETSLEQRP